MRALGSVKDTTVSLILRLPAAAGKAHCGLGGADDGFCFIDAFLLFAFGDRVVNDAGAGLHVHLAIFDEGGP